MRVLFEIVADQTNVGVALEELRARVKQLNAELKQNPGVQRSRELREEIVKTKTEIAKAVDEQKKLNREFKATQVPKDSLAGLRLEYARLSEQIAKLSKAERESAIGQGLVKSASGVKGEIDKIEQSIGRFTGNVGNYRSALLGVGDLLTGGLATGGIVVGVQKVIEVMQAGIREALAYEQALDDLSALTGLTGSDLSGLEAIAKGLETININGVEVVNTGTSILNALKLVGGAQPELLKNSEALGEVTRQAIILSKASGDGPAPSVEALTTVLGQFKAPASDSARIINELAAGAKEGASEIPDTTKALKEFGTVAQISNVSTGQSISLIELLADRQLKGAEAGTQLRNVLSKLASADILPKSAQAQFERLGIDVNKLKDTTLPLEVRLRELGKAQGDLSALTKIFGLENLQAATIITSGLPKYEQLAKAVEGTNEALSQAQTRADNTNTAFENLKNKGLNQLQEAFSQGTPVTRGLADAFSYLLDSVNFVQGAFDLAIGPIATVISGLQDLKGLWDDLFGDSQQGLADGAERAKVQFSGLGDTIDEATLGADALTKNIITGSRERQKALDDEVARALALGDGNEKAAAGAKKSSEEAKAAAGSVAALQKEIQRLQDQLNRTGPTDKGLGAVVAQLDAAQAALKSVQDRIEKIRLAGRVQSAARFAPSAGTDTAPDLGFVPTDFAASEKAAADKKREEAEKARQKDLEDEQQYQDKLLQINKEAFERKLKLDEEQREKEAKDKAERKDRNIQLAIEGGQAVANAVLEIERNRLDRQTSQALEALDAEYQKKIELAQGNSDLQDKLRREQEKKRLAIEKAAAKERQAIAIKEALIQGAINALKGFFTGGIAGVLEAAALTALQIFTIKSQTFARGGRYARDMSGGGHTGPSSAPADHTGARPTGLAMLHENEYVINARQARQFPGIINFLESDRRANRNYLASGGFATRAPQIALPSASSGTVQVRAEAGFSETQVAQLGQMIGKQTAVAVATQVRQALSDGLDDANRRNERQKALKANQQV